MCLHKCLHEHSAVVYIFRVWATEQVSDVFLRNHLGSKKNTFVIIVITFCNYPYAVLLEQRKTTVNLLLRSPSKHARPFHGAACFKGRVTLGSCVNTVMKQEHTVWMVKPWSSKASEPGQHIFCFCVTVKLAESWRKACLLC